MLLLFFLPLLVSAAQVDQATIDLIDMSTVDLGYSFGRINLEILDNSWTLHTSVSYFSVNKLNSTHYQTIEESKTYSYSFNDVILIDEKAYYGREFFTCSLTSSDLQCFNTWVLPIWQQEFIIHDAMIRKQLTSYQTGGAPLLSTELEGLLQ